MSPTFGGETNADRTVIINPVTDQSMDQSHDNMQLKWLADDRELA